LSPGLRARILQEHFQKGRCPDAKLTDKTSSIISRGETFLDLGRSDLFTLDHVAVVTAICEAVGGNGSDLEVRNLCLNDHSMTLDLVSPQLAEEVRPGDVLRGGLHVAHSEYYGQATQIMGYVLRLLCINGLLQRQCLGESRRSTPRTRRLAMSHPEAREMQMDQIRKIVARTWSGQEKLAAISQLQNKEVEIKLTLERFLRQAHLFSRGLMDLLLQAWETEGREQSAFGALNALTRVATHASELPGWKRQRLARLAGIFANQDVHLCPHCFSVLAN
jgi:hypothetical protein